MNRTPQNWIDAYLDGCIEPAELIELEAWINEDPSHAEQFANAVFLDERLTAEFTVRAFETELTPASAERRHVGKAVPAGTRIEDRSSTKVGTSIGFRFVIAASLLLVIGLAFWFARFDNDATLPVTKQEQSQKEVGDEDSLPAVDQATFATIAFVDQARWRSGVSFSLGDRLASQVIAIDEGLLKLHFDDGVEVTLEGPAEYELISNGNTRLISGLLTASVPPGAEGFRVDTPSAEVIDLGTEFGVEVGEDGVSEVSVFDGKVEVVSKPLGEQADSNDERKLLVEGESVRMEIDGTINLIQHKVERFEKLGRFSHGIARSTGDFRFAPPWRRLAQLKSDTKIFVLPEGFATELDKPCAIDISKPGLYRSHAELADGSIPASSRVKSYLLLFQPEDDEGEERLVKRITGSLTFAQPILGLVVTPEKLRDSDEWFAPRLNQSPPFIRALELTGHGGDIVTLSEDRKTVTLDLLAVGRGSDHLRVIVDATLTPSEIRLKELRERINARRRIQQFESEKGKRNE